MKREPKKAITIRITLEQYEALTQLAERSNRTLSSCIGQVIKRYLFYLERDLKEAERWNVI